MDVYKLTGKGLFCLFLGQFSEILSLVLALFSIERGIEIILTIIGIGLSIYGSYILKQAERTYRKVLILYITRFVIVLLPIFFFDSVMIMGLLTIATVVFKLVIFYYICSITATLLQGRDDILTKLAGTLWKMYLVCVMIVAISMAIIQLFTILAIFLMKAVDVVILVTYILYLFFLWQSRKVLQDYAKQQE